MKMPDYLKRVFIIFFAALIFAVVMYFLNEGKIEIKYGGEQSPKPSHTHEPGTPPHED